MKKKPIFFIIALVLLLGVVGGTYAYFTTGAVTHNVISTGRVMVELVEYSGAADSFSKEIMDALPGGSYDKVVMAKNTGESEAWVRITFTKTASDSSGKVLNADVIGLDTAGSGWLERDGWFYYDAPLKAGESTKPIGGTVVLPLGMGNEWQRAKLTIDVTMEAVQVANNGASVLDAMGWPETVKGDGRT